jgi:hypothetical protein
MSEGATTQSMPVYHGFDKKSAPDPRKRRMPLIRKNPALQWQIC